jgi:hypothetical protein
MMLAVAVLALASPSNAQYVITEIIDSTGDGGGNTLENPPDVAVDSSGTVYVAGYLSDNAFKIQPAPPVPLLSNRGLLVLGASLLCIVLWVARRQGMANA